jgi:hypothetical protein
MYSFLKNLSGNEIKVLMIIMAHSDERHEFGNMEKLLEYDISYPTILNCVNSLCKANYIKKIDMETGNASILRVADRFSFMADHLKKISNELFLFPEEPEPAKPKKWWNKKDQDALIGHYAKEQGVTVADLGKWFRINYSANIRAAQRVLDYCSSIEEAKQIITNCRIERSKSKLSWSLAGDILRNIQNFAPKTENLNEGGTKKWH